VLHIVLAIIVCIATCEEMPATENAEEHVNHRVLRTFPHPLVAFTEGLIVSRAKSISDKERKRYSGSKRRILFESCGMWGISSVRALTIDASDNSSQVDKVTSLDPETFAEGIALWGDNYILQLTYRSGVFNIFEKETLKLLGAIEYPDRTFREGWGMDSDQSSATLYVSDGSNIVHVLKSDESRTANDTVGLPKHFHLSSTIHVTATRAFAHDTRLSSTTELPQRIPVAKINDLAYDPIRKALWCIVEGSPCVARVNLQDGTINAWLNLRHISPRDLGSPFSDVGSMNGIAIDPEDGNLFVTGKNWPEIFEIEIQPPARSGSSSSGSSKNGSRNTRPPKRADFFEECSADGRHVASTNGGIGMWEAFAKGALQWGVPEDEAHSNIFSR